MCIRDRLNASIPFTAVWRVYFENAMVIYDGNTVTAYPHGSEPVVFDTEEAVKIPTGINVPPTGWYYAELGHFLSCIREGKPSPCLLYTSLPRRAGAGRPVGRALL